jgi:hypothetical protein
MPESGLLGYPGKGPPVDLDPNTQLFTSSGTWTKPADCQWVRVILVGGGGGGGGGGRGTSVAGSQGAGGTGGGGAGMSFIDVPAGLLPSTVPITIGAGGSGGNGSTTANTLGSSGSSGGTSTFGDILSASGGSGGGNNTSGQAGGGQGHLIGGNGSAAFFGQANASQSLATAGGAGGGGPTLGGADIGATPAGCANSARSPFLEPQKYGLIGQAGHGGGFNIFGTRINTVSNGTFGNGGGGGGGSKSDFNGENGGSGGDGYCLVVGYGTKTKPIDVQEFTTSGQWNKPTDPRLSTARVFVIGGGGGGGSGRRWDYNNGARLTGSHLALSSGSGGSFASAPDSAPLSITGDIDIQAKIAAFSWCEGDRIINNGNIETRTIVSKWTTLLNQRSYHLSVNSYGQLLLFWSNNGTTENSVTADATLDFESMTVKWVRATLDVNNGASGRTAKFYTSDDGSTWSQLGTDRVVATTTSIFDSTAVLRVGNLTTGTTSNKFEGFVYRVIIKNGYDGAGTTVFDANFETATAGAASFTESSANAATVTINNTPTNVFGGGGGGGGGVSYSEIPLSFLPQTVDVTVGLGGAGGAGKTVDYSNGNHGSWGGKSSFGTYSDALGGQRGYAGGSSAGTNAIGRGSSIHHMAYNSYNPGTLTGGGSSGTGNIPSGDTMSTSAYLGCFITGGGAGGGGISTGGMTGTGASSPKSLGYGTISSATTAASNGASIYPTTLGMFGSTGGGGGNSNAASVNGGNGVRGSGGGGGAGTTTGTTSGAGGNGGNGYVLVVCV